jgi:DNA-binding NarL/FixJ family response regulator
VDDHPPVLDVLFKILSGEDDIEIVAAVPNGKLAVSKAIDLKPDVIIMDVLMPRYSGLDAMNEIKKKLPNSKFLFLIFSDIGEELIKVLQAGVKNILFKSATVGELLEAVRKTAAGESVLPSGIAPELIVNNP